MKRNIVESYSIEEAFRALNKKTPKKVVEAINPEYKYIMYITYSTEDGQSDDQEQVNIIQSDGHYRVEGVSSVFGSLGDLIMDQISDAFDRAVEADAENPVDDEYNFADEWDIDFNISQNAYTKLTAADLVKIEGLLNRFSDIETVRKASLIADDIVDEDEAALNKPERNESKSRRASKKVVESVKDDLTKIIETQDAEAAADWIIKNTSCADPKRNIVDMCRDYGCRAQIYDILALDKYFRVAAPKLTKWWTIWDEDGAFGAAWNMLLIDSDNKIYGACAETQGGPFIYGLDFIPAEELADYLAKHPVSGSYIPADASDAAGGPGGFNNSLAHKICDECEAILPDLDDEDYM